MTKQKPLKYSNTMSDVDIVRACTSIKKRSASLRSNMHSVAVSIVYNWAEHGAVNVATKRATQLLASCDPALQQKVVNWFGVYCGFELSEDKETLQYSSDKTTISAEEYQAAKKETMFDLTPDNKPQAYILDEKIENIIKACKSKRTKGLKEGDSVPQEHLEQLEALLKSWTDPIGPKQDQRQVDEVNH